MATTNIATLIADELARLNIEHLADTYLAAEHNNEAYDLIASLNIPTE